MAGILYEVLSDPLFSGWFVLCTFGSFPKFLWILSQMHPGLKLLMLNTGCIGYAWNLSNKLQPLYLKKDKLGSVVRSEDNFSLVCSSFFILAFTFNWWSSIFLSISLCTFNSWLLVPLVMFLTTSTIFSECLSICIATSWNLSNSARRLASSFARISRYLGKKMLSISSYPCRF